MKLTDLEARFLRYRPSTETLRPGDRPEDIFDTVESLADAHGINFLCPKSYVACGGRVGAHSVRVYFAGSPVPPHLGKNKAGDTVRWTAAGSGLHDLDLRPSIQEQDDLCGWHGFVTNGEAA